MHGLKSVAGEPMLRGLSFEMSQEELGLPKAELLRERHKHIRRPKIPIILQNFVFQDQVIPKGIPSQV